MMDDAGLRRLFQEAREADEASAPRFGAVPRRRIPIYRRWREYATASVVAALALVVALFVRPQAPEGPPSNAVPVETNVLTFERWTAPTDFLLETPGRELLSSTPAIGLDIPELSVLESLSNPKGTRT
jgi:hypothetical protein